MLIATAKGRGTYLCKICVIISGPPIEEFPRKTSPKSKPQMMPQKIAASNGVSVIVEISSVSLIKIE